MHAHDKALRLAGGPSPGLRKRAYYEDGGAAGESGNAGAAGAGSTDLVIPPAPAGPPAAAASDLKSLSDKFDATGLGAGTPYSPKKPIDGPKLPGSMRRGGRSRR